MVWNILNQQLATLATIIKNFGKTDPFGGYMDLGHGGGCEVCRWDGPIDAPAYNFTFPDPAHTVTYGECQWRCYSSQMDFTQLGHPWPIGGVEPAPCSSLGSFEYDETWGWQTVDNGLYVVEDEIHHCAWTGDCEVGRSLQPPKDEAYTAGGNCTNPSWWSCRMGPADGTVFNTGLGYYERSDIQGMVRYEEPTLAFRLEHQLPGLCWLGSPVTTMFDGIPCPSDPSKVLWIGMTTFAENGIPSDPRRCSWNRYSNDLFWRSDWLGFCGEQARLLPTLPTTVDDAGVQRVSKLPTFASTFDHYGTADPYGGYMDLGTGAGCEVCRWDGPMDAPRYNFTFPDPATAVSFGEYRWKCFASGFDFSDPSHPWPIGGIEPTPCNNLGSYCYDETWGWETVDNDLYFVQDEIYHCAWTGNCEVDANLQPPKDQPYTAGWSCTDPSWWSCRIGYDDGISVFNTALGHFPRNDIFEFIRYDRKPTLAFIYRHQESDLCWAPEITGNEAFTRFEGIPCPSDATKILWMRMETIGTGCDWDRYTGGIVGMRRAHCLGFCGEPGTHVPSLPTEVDDERVDPII